MKIISHRGFLNGRQDGCENKAGFLREATLSGFDVEFDINFSPQRDALVLSHDETPWTDDRDPLSFIAGAAGRGFHALNVKNMLTVFPVTRLLEQTHTKENFFLFDFELLENDLPGTRFLMKSLTEQGFRVAYRLSERELHFEEYLNDPFVNLLWLDEIGRSWINRSHVERLAEKGKRTFVVSPELHSRVNEKEMVARWRDLIGYGVDGICTDYPVQLRALLGN